MLFHKKIIPNNPVGKPERSWPNFIASESQTIGQCSAWWGLRFIWWYLPTVQRSPKISKDLQSGWYVHKSSLFDVSRSVLYFFINLSEIHKWLKPSLGWSQMSTSKDDPVVRSYQFAGVSNSQKIHLEVSSFATSASTWFNTTGFPPYQNCYLRHGFRTCPNRIPPNAE